MQHFQYRIHHASDANEQMNHIYTEYTDRENQKYARLYQCLTSSKPKYKLIATNNLSVATPTLTHIPFRTTGRIPHIVPRTDRTIFFWALRSGYYVQQCIFFTNISGPFSNNLDRDIYPRNCLFIFSKKLDLSTFWIFFWKITNLSVILSDFNMSGFRQA